MKFSIYDNRNFQITFDNGLTLSTSIGAGSYSDNHMKMYERGTEQAESKTGEIAVFVTKAGNWLTKEVMNTIGEDPYDDVVGYVNTKRWLEIANATANYKP